MIRRGMDRALGRQAKELGRIFISVNYSITTDLVSTNFPILFRRVYWFPCKDISYELEWPRK